MTDAELNGHIDTLKEACDWMNHEATEDLDLGGGKLLDFVTSASAVIAALESARRERDEAREQLSKSPVSVLAYTSLLADYDQTRARHAMCQASLATACAERDKLAVSHLAARAEAEQLRAERDALAAELSESHEDHKATCEKALAKGFV